MRRTQAITIGQHLYMHSELERISHGKQQQQFGFTYCTWFRYDLGNTCLTFLQLSLTINLIERYFLCKKLQMFYVSETYFGCLNLKQEMHLFLHNWMLKWITWKLFLENEMDPRKHLCSVCFNRISKKANSWGNIDRSALNFASYNIPLLTT